MRSHFSSLTLSLKRLLHLSQNSTSPLQYLQGLILPVLFDDAVEAVLAVLEMVLAMVWLPRDRHWDSAPLLRYRRRV